MSGKILQMLCDNHGNSGRRRWGRRGGWRWRESRRYLYISTGQLCSLCKGSFALYFPQYGKLCLWVIAVRFDYKIILATNAPCKLTTKGRKFSLKSGVCHLLGKSPWRHTAAGCSVPVTAGAHQQAFICLHSPCRATPFIPLNLEHQTGTFS